MLLSIMISQKPLVVKVRIPPLTSGRCAAKTAQHDTLVESVAIMSSGNWWYYECLIVLCATVVINW